MADVDGARKITSQLKDIFPEIAAQAGLPERHVAKVCRLLLIRIQKAVENDEVLKSKHLTFKSSTRKAKPANEKRKAMPETKVGRIIIKPDVDQDQDN
jgi:hypothetical protein